MLERRDGATLGQQQVDADALAGQPALEEDLVNGRVKALVATSALGMGFDARLGFVVNMGAPASPVAYYQQVGRAGRGTDEATVVLLPATEDRDIWAYFASLTFPREELVRQTLDVLAGYEVGDATWAPRPVTALATAVRSPFQYCTTALFCGSVVPAYSFQPTTVLPSEATVAGKAPYCLAR